MVRAWLVAALIISCLGQRAPSRESPIQNALTLEQQGRFAEAEAAWRSVLSHQPNDSQAYAHLGLLEARQEHYREAIADYRKALSINANMPSVEINLGLALFKSGDLRDAIRVFHPVLDSTPRSSAERIRLVTLIGLAHYGLGEYQVAVPYLKEAADSDPGNLALRMTLAQSCLSSKQYQCVLDTYREILSINPNSAEADMLAGEAYDELKNEAGALEQFQAAAKADPKFPNVHFGYGYLLWKVQRLEEAEKEFRSEIANNPDNALALAYLGDTEIKLNHPEEATPNLERAVRIQPSLAIAHLDLGISYAAQGKKEDALRELNIAEKLNPNDSVAHWQLGRLYQSMGRKSEAQAEFNKTKDLQNARQESLREKMHQANPAPAGQKGGSGPE